MEGRLQWIRQAPAAWCHWEPVRGGLEGHALVAQRYPQAACAVYEHPAREAAAREALGAKWWARWRTAAPRFGLPEAASVHMLWSNMALHTAADPQALIAQWHRAIAVDGFLMFSCLGPDTVRELHALYRDLGWPPAGHALTDMHDWGDMLVQAGFAEPVMDMERITLSYSDASKLRAELRELGRNLHPARFAGLRGRQWLAQLDLSLERQLARADEGGRLVVTFEIIYGHAFKPTPRVKLEGEARISMQDMQQMLRQGRLPRE